MRTLLRSPRRAAFTLVELLVVITIIVILVGLTVGVAGYANQRAARSRAETEVKGLGAALENYKADNGIYPRDATTTDVLDAHKAGSPSATTAPSYSATSKFLYNQLTGQDVGKYDYPPVPLAGAKIYFDFKPNMLGGKDGSGKYPNGVTAINDPYGYSYGYSTAYQADVDKTPTAPTPPAERPGINPTFDLWSTGGTSTTTMPTVVADRDRLYSRWIVNW